MNPDWIDLLRCFNDHQVEYLLVGALAVVHYTEPRYTKDMDVWVNPTPENAQRVYNALVKFGAPVTNVTAADFASPGFFRMGHPPLAIDVLMSVADLNFPDCWQNRQIVVYEGVEVGVLGYDDVVRAKTAAGRPQDLIDLENLKTSKKAEDFIRKTKGE